MGFVWVLACAIPGWFLLRSGWRRLWPLNRNAAPIDLGILGHRRNALRHAGLTLLLVATLVGIGYWLRYENSQNRSVSPPDPRFEALLAEWSTGKPVVTELELVGNWLAKDDDIPSNVDLSVWQRHIHPKGILAESMSTRDRKPLPGPACTYTLAGSALTTDCGAGFLYPDQDSEVRTFPAFILIKRPTGIFRFHRIADN